MSNLESLTRKILDDAKDEASLILQESDKVMEEMLESRIKEANDKKNKIIERAKQEASMIKERVISNAELSRRDSKLAAKQQLMDSVFDLAKDKLKNLSEEKFAEFIFSSLKNLNLKGTEKIIVPENMKNKAKSLGLSIPISEDENVESGFIIKDKDSIINYTFDSLVNFYREELESKIAKELFEEE